MVTALDTILGPIRYEKLSQLNLLHVSWRVQEHRLQADRQQRKSLQRRARRRQRRRRERNRHSQSQISSTWQCHTGLCASSATLMQQSVYLATCLSCLITFLGNLNYDNLYCKWYVQLNQWNTLGATCISVCNQPVRSTQPCIPPGLLNRVPALLG